MLQSAGLQSEHFRELLLQLLAEEHNPIFPSPWDLRAEHNKQAPNAGPTWMLAL